MFSLFPREPAFCSINDAIDAVIAY
jgi:hypothetical protein